MALLQNPERMPIPVLDPVFQAVVRSGFHMLLKRAGDGPAVVRVDHVQVMVVKFFPHLLRRITEQVQKPAAYLQNGPNGVGQTAENPAGNAVAHQTDQPRLCGQLRRPDRSIVHHFGSP